MVVEKETYNYNSNKKKRRILRHTMAIKRKVEFLPWKKRDKYQVRWGEDIEGDNRPPAEAVSAVS